MAKYVKKPVVIEAFKWTGGPDQTEDPDWAVHALETGGMFFAGKDLYIQTLEGNMHVTPGDYIIKGLQGELYPCKPDIFEASYEKVD